MPKFYTSLTAYDTITVGVDDTGHDVKFFGATSGQYLLWDESADKLIVTGEIEAGSLDISGNVDVDGTLEADAITVNGTTLANYIPTVNANKITVTDSNNDEAFPVVFHDEGGNTLLDDTGIFKYNPNSGTLYTTKLIVSGTSELTSALTLNAGTPIVFEGASQDAHETSLSIVDPTGDRTQYVINQSGYIPLLAAVTTTQITSTPAELNLLDGSSANSVVNNAAVIYGSSGELAGTLSTAAQGNITSLGTLTALTVDDVAINGKVITMTGSSSDTAVFTAGTNGTLSIVTTDAAAAAANIQITADGTVDIDSAGVLTLDSGAAINIEPASGSAILLDGTISVDAGVVTGATSITSSAFVGDITGNVEGAVTGNADTATVGTSVTVTDNNETNETTYITFVDGASGTQGIETEGKLTYNPSLNVLTSSRKFTVTSSTDGDYDGDVVYFGGTTSMTTGAIYHYKSDGTWELADADAVATADGLLGVALGAASDTNGVLLRGMVTIDHDPGAIGDVLFLSTTAGDCSATAPSGNNDVIRVIGYQVSHASNGNIWFNPDNTYVEVSA